jgi:tRNA(Ile)-lysidine synthase TilS/MesJ
LTQLFIPKILNILDSDTESQLIENICTQLEIPKIIDILISSHENKVPTLEKIQNSLKYLFLTMSVRKEKINAHN